MDTLPCAFCETPLPRKQLRRDHELDICDPCATGGAQAAMLARGNTLTVREWTTSVRSPNGSHYTIHHMAVTARSRTEFSVTADFSREGFIDKLRKLFRREIQIGDPLFDDFVFIKTEDRSETEALLHHSGAQSTLMELVSRFDRVSLANGVVELHKQSMQELGLGLDSALAVCALLVHIERRHDGTAPMS